MTLFLSTLDTASQIRLDNLNDRIVEIVRGSQTPDKVEMRESGNVLEQLQ